LAFSDSSFRTVTSDKEGMMPRVIGLLFFALAVLVPVHAEDYVLLKGDTLAGIASKTKVPVDLLQRANPDMDLQHLKAGAALSIPGRYTVKAGDTLYSLCRLWGVDQAAVLALNGWPANYNLKRGQTVYYPAAATSPTPTPATVAAPASGPVFWPVDRKPHPEGDKLKSVTFATTGEAFRSVSSGTVVYLGEFRGVGRVLLVQGADKTVFAYGNFESAEVQFGQNVSRGQVLGVTSPRPSQKLSFFAFLQSDPLDVYSAKR
jgi:murein DD-endopeptidase MepM/ murein hydrolase activator NlpD